MEMINHHNHHNLHNDMTPEKSALVRISNTELDGDIMSDAGTVNGYRGSALARSGSLRSFRRQSSILRTSRVSSSSSSYAKFSAELTAQAESKFKLLMEVIASASSEASSLKAIWESMKHEREVFLQEHEALISQTSELSTELRAREDERSRHSTEAVDWKKKVERVLVELAAAHASVTSEKERVVERDTELEKMHVELREARDSLFRKDNLYERELDTLKARLAQVETERVTATEASDKYYRELNRAVRERTELNTKLTDITASYESTQKDVVSLTSRLRTTEAEREEYLQTVERLKEELQRVKQKSTEDSREAVEATEKYEKAIREVARLKEAFGVVEVERDEHLQTIETLRRQIKNHKGEYDELTGRFAEVTRDHDATRRELITTQESLKAAEATHEQHVQTLSHVRQTLHSVTRERDDLVDEVQTITKRLEDQRSHTSTARDNLLKSEEKMSELQVEITSLNEKVLHAHRERDEARSKSSHNLTEVRALRERIAALEHEKREAFEARTETNAELERLRSEYTQVTETMTSFDHDTEDLEQEIENLQALVREAQEQRERAVSARESADRERDTYISRYDDKCRELERLRESLSLSRTASYSHHHHNGSHRNSRGLTTSSRTITSRSVSHLDGQSSSGHESGAQQLNSSSLSGAVERNSAETPLETSVGA